MHWLAAQSSKAVMKYLMPIRQVAAMSAVAAGAASSGSELTTTSPRVGCIGVVGAVISWR
jgi:hypothetical protein